MKRIIISLVLISVCNIFAQVNSNYDGVKPKVKAGTKSLVFSYTPFQSNLAPLTSGIINDEDMTMEIQGIGFKIFPANRFSLLLNFGYGSANENDDEENEEYSFGYFGTGLDFNFHFKSLYNISTYIGGNVNFNLTALEITGEDYYDDYTFEYSSVSFGTGINLGFDWYFTERISLGGKYTFNFTITPGSETKYDYDEYEGPSSVAMGVGTGGFILNVYF